MDASSTDDDRAHEPAGTAASLRAFEVVDVLGLARLTRRSPTLGGSVPLRVAQACQPLLEGNAFGHQVTLTTNIEVRRSFGRYSVRVLERAAELARLHRATMPVLFARGLLRPDSEWAKTFADSFVSTRSFSGPRAPVALFTGLFLRPRAGVRLRQSSTKNRRALSYDVREAIVLDSAALTPLVLEIDPRSDCFALAGDIATLAPHPEHVRVRQTSLEEAPDVAAAHIAFYDRTYFETKQGGDTSRKYRRMNARNRSTVPADLEAPVAIDVVEAGPVAFAPGAAAVVHGPLGAQPAASSGNVIDRVVVRSSIGLVATFDGQHVTVTPDADALGRFAAAVRDRWQPTLARAGDGAHKGALLYLTKYVTPHPPGEPHFFVKPPALFRTASGVATLLEGGGGPGFEVMRGVIASDSFHAAPAVFQLTAPGSIAIPAGAPLLELFPIPRALLDSECRVTQGGLLAPTAPGAPNEVVS